MSHIPFQSTKGFKGFLTLGDGLEKDEQGTMKVKTGSGVGYDGDGQLTSTWSSQQAVSNVDMDGYSINNLANPHSSTDGATKAYVDSRAPLSQLESGLRAYFNFEDYNDVVGGYNGTPQGASLNLTSDAGIINKGLEFGTNTDVLDTGDAWDIGSSDFTISFWEYPKDNSAGIHCIWNNESTVPRFGILHRLDVNGEYEMYTQDDTVSEEVKTVKSETLYTAINQWYHIVFKREGTTGSIYVNGELDGSGEVIGTNISAPGQSSIRRTVASQSACYIDEVGVWERALTADEISYLYNDGLATNDFSTYDYTYYYDIDMKQHQIHEIGGMQTKTVKISDDSTYTYTPANKAGVIMVAVSDNVAQVFYDIADSPDIRLVSQLKSSFSISLGSSTGTTGFDNKFTIFVDEGEIIFENRLGQAEDVRFLVML